MTATLPKPEVKTTSTPAVETSNRTAIELFAGAGGLALGLRRAGYRPQLVVEIDKRSTATLERNHAFHRGKWPIHAGDVVDVDFKPYAGKIDLLSAGAPCQPFSNGGLLRGEDDHRNMFPQVVRAVEEIGPKAFVVENVRGLLFERHKPFLDRLLRMLRNPSDPRSSNKPSPTDEYLIRYEVLNSADFGLAQSRPRLFIVGTRADQAAWAPPTPTHSKEELLRQLHADEYWERHEVPSNVRDRVRETIAPAPKPTDENRKPWFTVRDMLAELGPPAVTASESGDHSHVYVPGARLYKKHTGSRLDWVAKTVKAGVHGCPGGEHIIVLDDGTHRYFSVRECATLQGFPRTYRLPDKRTNAMRQLGNAVPVAVAEAVAKSILGAISE